MADYAVTSKWRSRSLGLVLLCCALSGCFPELMTARPKADITVTDTAGTPLENSSVKLLTYSRFAQAPEVTEYRTDSQGHLKITRDMKWVVQVMLPDATVDYGWTLCVTHDGHKGVLLPSPDFSKPVRIALPASVAPSDCRYRPDRSAEVVEWIPGAWIEVDGGDWRPDPQTLKEIADGIRLTAKSHAQGLGRELAPWPQYLFQYQGRVAANAPYVRIEALCQAPRDFNLRVDFYEGESAGSCRFDMTYDVVRARFDSFEMSAAAGKTSR